jgi:hypothetical protein
MTAAQPTIPSQYAPYAGACQAALMAVNTTELLAKPLTHVNAFTSEH